MMCPAETPEGQVCNTLLGSLFNCLSKLNDLKFYSIPCTYFDLVVDQACGLVKNLALKVYITVGSAAYPILEFLDEWGTEKFEVLKCYFFGYLSLSNSCPPFL